MAAAAPEYDHAAEEEKPVFIRASKKDGVGCDWYKLDLKKSSSIYVLGGVVKQGIFRDKICDDVYILDTRHPQDGWKKAASMLCGDYSPPVVALGGKLYHLSNIPEVFDPMSGNNGCWFPIEAEVPYNGPGATALISDSSNGRFLAYFMGTEVYSYSLESQKWDCLSTDEKFSHFDFQWHASVVVDDVLYFYDYRSILSEAIVAYDLVNKIWLDTASCKPFPLYLHTESWNILLHLGNGILCLLECNPPVDGDTIVDCIKFRVKKTVSGPVVFMTALSEYALPLKNATFVLNFFTLE
ncbi:unnamed protein product [Dovyalis caffra]|uniref:Uncharacterized protein n=1 Tax=Dovyalis caffra TaxID=77055 RepID=A0AAV1RSR3_9ROSI|nr:unnamed protein product [Dovyalis caffra]